ncbi:MAG: LptE family protein [Bacteroidales bacterium]|nr:LptE family protein [Bacteroidales bacterium]
MSRIKSILLSLALLLLAAGCFTVSYDLTGGVNIDYSKIQTVSVQYFSNRASRIEPSLSQNFTDALKDYLESNTKLRVVNSIGDVDFSGEITDYRIEAAAIAAGDVAAKTRFTITLRVKYTSSVEPDKSFDTSFSRYREFDSTTDFSSVEASLTEEIIDEIIEQIFNKAFVNW